MTSDLEKLQGTWRIVELELDGRKMPAGGSTIVVEDDGFTTAGMGAAYRGTVTVDSARNPKTFDLIFADGPHAGEVSPGIYSLDGDTWTICLGLAGRSRPGAFATAPGSGHALEVLRRETASESPAGVVLP